MDSSEDMSDAVGLWDRLHAQPRFRPRYPNDHVIRFLVGTFPEDERSERSVLDIGVGGGRHVKLLCDMGFRAAGVDISEVGLDHCRRWLAESGQTADLRLGSMTDLPFPDGSFDGAVSFGVFYYGDGGEFRAAVDEMHRVLEPGGKAIVVCRTTDDYRYGKGEQLEPNTFRLEIEDTNEGGSVMHFLSEEDIPRVFAAFGEVHFERTETTSNDRTRVDSDWIVKVTR